MDEVGGRDVDVGFADAAGNALGGVGGSGRELVNGEASVFQDGDVGERATDINTDNGAWHVGSVLRGVVGRVGRCDAGGDLEAAKTGIDLVIVLGAEPLQLGLGSLSALALLFGLTAFLLGLLLQLHVQLLELVSPLFRLCSFLSCFRGFLFGFLNAVVAQNSQHQGKTS